MNSFSLQVNVELMYTKKGVSSANFHPARIFNKLSVVIEPRPMIGVVEAQVLNQTSLFESLYF